MQRSRRVRQATAGLLHLVSTCINLLAMARQQTIDVDRLKQLRQDAGLSLRALSDLCADNGCRISPSQLSKVERGLNFPGPRRLHAICQSLHTTRADVIRDATAAAAP